jgi:hypothetical protein
MTDRAKPVRTATLLTPAMQTPHESLNISFERGLLAAVMGNPAFGPGVVDVYDVSRDCRQPELMASSPASLFGHESGMALDGRTFYPTSIGTGHTAAVDLSNPRTPIPLGRRPGVRAGPRAPALSVTRRTQAAGRAAE